MDRDAAFFSWFSDPANDAIHARIPDAFAAGWEAAMQARYPLRQFLAGAAMQGMVDNQAADGWNNARLARAAVTLTDALLDELERPRPTVAVDKPTM